MGSKKEERKERREDRREERRRRSDQGENSWDLGELEPAVVTADATRDGGSISASEVAAKGKTMPNLQGKAVVQNPSQMEIRYNNPEIPQYGGALDASSAQAERKSMPSMQGKAEVQNPSDIGNMPNPPQYGGQLPTSGVRAEGRAMPNIQGKAAAMNPSDIGRMPNPPQYGGELSAATTQAEGRNLPNMQGKAEVQNPSDIGGVPQYGGEIESSEVNAEGKKINEPKAQAEALTKAGISQKRYEPTDFSEQLPDLQGKAEVQNRSDIGKMPTPTSGSSEKQEVEKKGDEEGSAEVDGGELDASRVFGERKAMPTLQAKAEAMTKAGISQKRYQPNQLPEDSDEESAESQTTESTATDAKAEATPAAETTQPKNDELDALDASHKEYMDALKNYNQQRFDNLGAIGSAIEAKIKEAQQKDEKARKRENAFRYISGLGDTLSSIANLVGTAHGASHQKQHYNSSDVVKKAEEARKARKLEMDDLSKRLDEMKTRQMELKAAGSLKEAELKVAQDKEKAKLLADQRKAEEEKRRFDVNHEYRKERDKVEDAQKDRTFSENQRQYNETHKRLTDDAAADRRVRKEIAEANNKADLERQREKLAADPKHQANTLQKNITGIRDELAKKMGYADYNEYLRYKNADGWGADIDGQRNRESRRIRDERASMNPETEEFLDMLGSPENLSEEQVRMLMGASKVFSDAVNSSTTTTPKGGQGGNTLNPNQDKNL